MTKKKSAAGDYQDVGETAEEQKSGLPKVPAREGQEDEDWFEPRVDEALQALKAFAAKLDPVIETIPSRLNSLDRGFEGLREVTDRLAHQMDELMEQTASNRSLRDRCDQLELERETLRRELAAAKLQYKDLGNSFQQNLLGLAQQMSSLVNKSGSDRDSLVAELAQVRGELQALKHRFQQAFEKAALDLNEGQVASNHGPQHDQLIERFRHLKQQTFEQVAIDIYNLHATVRHSDIDLARRSHIGKIKHLLTTCVLHSSGNGESSSAAMGRVIEGLSRNHFKVSDPGKVSICVTEGLKLLRDMAAARPPALAFVPESGERFDRNRHDAAPGCLTEGDLVVQFVVFPGYEIKSNPRAMVKAEVRTLSLLEWQREMETLNAGKTSSPEKNKRMA